MKEYYCRLCETKQVETNYDVICPTCKSRYCHNSIKEEIDEKQYSCPHCSTQLIEIFREVPLVSIEVKILVELARYLKTGIFKVKYAFEDFFGFTALPESIGKLSGVDDDLQPS